MNNYMALQEQAIRDYRIVMRPDSDCWKRTHAHVDQRMICKHTPKESYASLFLLLHEIGHIETHKPGMKRCEQESEAVRWSIAKLRELGLPVKRRQLASYKKYVRMTYDRGVRRGLSKRIKSKLIM